MLNSSWKVTRLRPRGLREGVEILEMEKGLTQMANPLKYLVELTPYKVELFAYPETAVFPISFLGSITWKQLKPEGLKSNRHGVEAPRDFESISVIRRFLIIFKYLGFRHLQALVGLAWVNLGYFRSERLHFGYTCFLAPDRFF